MLSLWAGWQHLRYVRAEHARTVSGFTPPAAVIVPCRGLDDGFQDNLRALIEQDYPGFQLVCVVESRDDPTYQEVCRIRDETGVPYVHVVEAGSAQGRGQKVHNLLAGLDYVERRLMAAHGIEVYVFADSDGRVGSGWLRALVTALEEKGVGATTGYRWYRAEGNFWTLLRSLWNASIVTAFGPHRRNFAWGGATAIRRATAEAIRLRDAWHDVLSDDYALTGAVRTSGYGIKFVPDCLVVSSGTCSFGDLLEFTNRQITITRIYAPRLWLIVSGTNLLFSLVFLSSVGLLLNRVVTGGSVTWPIVALAMIYLPGVAKGIIRERAVELMRPELEGELRRFRWAYWLLHPLVSFLYVVNAVASALRREITWRGIRYRVVSPTTIQVIGSSVSDTTATRSTRSGTR